MVVVTGDIFVRLIEISARLIAISARIFARLIEITSSRTFVILIAMRNARTLARLVAMTSVVYVHKINCSDMFKELSKINYNKFNIRMVSFSD